MLTPKKNNFEEFWWSCTFHYYPCSCIIRYIMTKNIWSTCKCSIIYFVYNMFLIFKDKIYISPYKLDVKHSWNIILFKRTKSMYNKYSYYSITKKVILNIFLLTSKFVRRINMIRRISLIIQKHIPPWTCYQKKYLLDNKIICYNTKKIHDEFYPHLFRQFCSYVKKLELSCN